MFASPKHILTIILLYYFSDQHLIHDVIGIIVNLTPERKKNNKTYKEARREQKKENKVKSNKISIVD